MTYSSSCIFSTINKIPISVKRSNFAVAHFKAAWHANPGAERSFDDQAYIQDTLLESCNVLVLTKKYYSLNFFMSKSLKTRYLCA